MAAAIRHYFTSKYLLQSWQMHLLLCHELVNPSLRRVCVSDTNPSVISWWKRLWADNRHEASVESPKNSRFIDFWNCIHADSSCWHYWEDKVGTVIGLIILTFALDMTLWLWHFRFPDDISSVLLDGNSPLHLYQVEDLFVIRLFMTFRKY